MTIILKYLFLVLTVLLLQVAPTIAMPVYLHYQLEDGLPSMQVYKIMQDSKGFIWLASAQGVSRFDGTTFYNITTAQGLPDNEVLNIKEDENGKIWLQTAKGKTASIKDLKVKVEKTTLFGKQIIQTGDVIIDYTRSIDQARDSLTQNVLIQQKKYFLQSISCRFDESTNNIWLGTWGGGAFYCQNYQSPKAKIQAYLPNKTITDIIIDQEQNTWFATLGEGVYVLTNRYATQYNKRNGLPFNEIFHISSDDTGNIWAGSSKGTLSCIRPDTIINYEVGSSVNTYNRVHDVFITYTGSKWISMDEGLKLMDAQNQSYLVYSNPVKKVIKSGKDKLWIANYNKPVELDVYLGGETKKIPLQQVNSIFQDTKGILWLATENGLYHSKEDTTFYWGEKDPLLAKSMNDLFIDQHNRLFMALDGGGLLIKDQQDLYNITTKEGLISNICQSLFYEANDNIWLATNKGLTCLQLATDNCKILQIENYNYLDGLPSNHVNDMVVKGDEIWVATLNGIAVLNKKGLKKNKQKPPIYFQHIQINNQDTLIKQKYILPYHQNNLKIAFIGLSYRTDGQVNYRYQMEGVDTTWRYTPLNSIQYPALQPGQYTFKVVAIDKDGNQSPEAIQLSFWILQPFWNTWLFTILASLLFLLLMAGIAYFIIQYFKNRNELRRRLVESEQMALRAQMNPHFIFNSLNSIQYFITENDKKSANLYLSTFSTLIRKVLDHSQKSAISLEEELDYLKLYLDIESLRFKDKFEHGIDVDADIEEDEIRIPPMLIQPYVENAIRHGLLQKKSGKRWLNINFKLEGTDLLLCEVEDNGIGRAQAQLLKKDRPSSAHKGIGTTNPKERLEILNQMNRGKIEVKFTDKKDEKGMGIGTKVAIRIPILE